MIYWKFWHWSENDTIYISISTTWDSTASILGSMCKFTSVCWIDSSSTRRNHASNLKRTQNVTLLNELQNELAQMW